MQHLEFFLQDILFSAGLCDTVEPLNAIARQLVANRQAIQMRLFGDIFTSNEAIAFF